MIKKIVLSSVVLSSLMLVSCDNDDNNNAAVTPASTNVQIRFDAVGPNGFAPVLFATHTGDFDFFDTGSAATAQLEPMAELGDVSQIAGLLKSTDNSVQTTGPLAPGGNATLTLTVDAANRYFSYAGMLLPSSDAFVGNNNPISIDLQTLIANSNGNPIVIEVNRVYDAGTEVNDFLTAPGGGLVGAPAGVATAGVTEGANITLISPTHFAGYANQGTFNGSSLDSAAGASVGRITITVLP